MALPGSRSTPVCAFAAGRAAGGNFPKHSFNVFFRGEYGASKLEFPLFGTEGSAKFDTLSLRCEHGYAYADPYAINYRLEFTAMRDVCCRELRAAAGYASTRSGYYHLLLPILPTPPKKPVCGAIPPILMPMGLTISSSMRWEAPRRQTPPLSHR